MTDLWITYFKKLKESCSKGTEHTSRTVLENIIEDVKPNKKLKITQEPKRVIGFGAPDFKVEKDGAIVGYIETKPIGENLDEIRKSDQLKKYYSVATNLILTNYIEFLLLKKGEIIERVQLCDEADLKSRTAKLDENQADKIEGILQKFFIEEPMKISNAKELAIQLAERGKIVREYVLDILKQNRDDEFSQKVKALFEVFKSTLVADLSEDEFADAYAQTVLYGFFLAFLQSEKRISLEDASRLVPSSFKVIKEFFTVINDYDLPSHIRWIFQEVVNLINNVDMGGIYESLSFKKKHAKGDADPYLYFYETFLSAFDAKKKKAKGVYYTPMQVVSFITRSVDYLLDKRFRKHQGFADPSVTVLDFASGTGTFLVAIFELVFEHLEKDKGRLRRLVKEHLLKDFYGFEYLVAPYAVAHLKLSQLLKDNGFKMESDDRLQVYLTDTLDHSEHKAIGMMPYLTKESEAATKIKSRHPILVITGNPPYNSRSRNNKDWIIELMENYKPRGEKNIQPLNDDYIKFIRFAHWKIEQSKHGVVGIITNNSFLSGLIHRTMRGQLLETFDEIYILNLHGNLRYGEKTPEGLPDENVFDIQQGVSISLFVKKEVPNEKGGCRLYYYDVYGEREEKYDFLLENSLSNIEWKQLTPNDFDASFKKTRWGRQFQDKLNFFSPMENVADLKVYGDFLGIEEIFPALTSGVKSGNDEEYVKFKNEFSKQEKEKVFPFHYRPFDVRFLLYDPEVIQRARYDILKNMKHKNVALICPRMSLEDNFTYGLVSESLGDVKLGGKNSGSETFIAPLYIYNEGINGGTESLPFLNQEERKSNFADEFTKYIKARYKKAPTPEQILGYIYAILYAPSYREKYLEYLKIDFPRIPFVEDEKLFYKISVLGSELIEHHLMKQNYPKNNIKYPVAGDDAIEEVRYEVGKSSGRIYINKTQYFENVTKEIWEFEIGGYQVLEKWLRSRRDKKENTLSYQEQETFMQICNILSFTINQMGKIDGIVKRVMGK